MKTTVLLDVTELATGKVVHTVTVHDATEGKVEGVIRGMLINMDRDRFVVGEREKPKRKKSKARK